MAAMKAAAPRPELTMAAEAPEVPVLVATGGWV